MYARTEGVRRLRSMYRKTSSSAYRMDPSNLSQEGPSPTLRQYRSVPSGTDSILATMLVVRSFNWIGRAGDPSHDEGAGAVVTLAVVFIVPPGKLSCLDLHHYTDLLQTIDELAQ